MNNDSIANFPGAREYLEASIQALEAELAHAEAELLRTNLDEVRARVASVRERLANQKRPERLTAVAREMAFCFARGAIAA